jgi:hypothetical protein
MPTQDNNNGHQKLHSDDSQEETPLLILGSWERAMRLLKVNKTHSALVACNHIVPRRIQMLQGECRNAAQQYRLFAQCGAL